MGPSACLRDPSSSCESSNGILTYLLRLKVSHPVQSDKGHIKIGFC